jgi:hypothetical protein
MPRDYWGTLASWETELCRERADEALEALVAEAKAAPGPLATSRAKLGSKRANQALETLVAEAVATTLTLSPWGTIA